MATEVVFEQKQFIASMKEFTRETGFSAHDVLRDQMRLFAKSASAMTPPKKAAAGKRAVDRSLKNIFGVIDDKQTLNELDDAFGHRLFPLQFDMHPAEMLDHHERFRNKKTGRTPKYDRTVRAGKATFGAKPYVLKSEFNKYARIRKQKIGRLKAGWNRAAQVFGFMPSKWISKHGSTEGTARDRFNPSLLTGYLEAINRVPYSGRHARIPQVAMQGRVRALRTRLDRELERIAKSKSA